MSPFSRSTTQGAHRGRWVDNVITGSKPEGYDDWAARIQFLHQPSDTFSALFNVHGRVLDGRDPGSGFRANIIQPGSEGQLVPGFDRSKMYTDARDSGKHSNGGRTLD